MFGHRLVLADDAKRKAETRAGDQPADREHRDRETEQLPVDVVLGDIDEHVAAEHPRLVDLVPDHELADEFGEAEGEDDEMQAAEPQRGNADDHRHQRADRGGDQQHQRPCQHLAEHRHGIGADAEERGGRQRHVTCRPGEQSPCGGKHGELQQADREREIIGIGVARQQRQHDKACAAGNRRLRCAPGSSLRPSEQACRLDQQDAEEQREIHRQRQARDRRRSPPGIR